MQQANSKKREKADSEEAWSGARTKAQPPRSGRRVLPETERKRPNALAALQRDNRKRKKETFRLLSRNDRCDWEMGGNKSVFFNKISIDFPVERRPYGIYCVRNGLKVLSGSLSFKKENGLPGRGAPPFRFRR